MRLLVKVTETCKRHTTTSWLLSWPDETSSVARFFFLSFFLWLLLPATVFWLVWHLRPSTLKSQASSPDLRATTEPPTHWVQLLRRVSSEAVYMEIEHWSVSPGGNEYMEWYRHAVWTLSFIFNTLLPGGDSPVLSAVIANWFCSLFLLVARHKSKCLSRPQCSWDTMCVLVPVCVYSGGSEGSVWTGRVSTINPASDLQAAAPMTLCHYPIGITATCSG